MPLDIAFLIGFGLLGLGSFTAAVGYALVTRRRRRLQPANRFSIAPMPVQPKHPGGWRIFYLTK